MNVLCILTKLYLPGGGDVKEDAYPTLVKTYVRAGFNVTALTLSTPTNLSPGAIKGAEAIMGGAEILPVRAKNLLRLPVLVLKYWDLLLLRYIWTYRHLLMSVDDYFIKHGTPDVLAALTAVENTGIVAYLIGKRYGISYTVLETRTAYGEGLVSGKRAAIARKVIGSADTFLVVSPRHSEDIRTALGTELPHTAILTYAIPDSFFEKPVSIPLWMREFSKDRFIFAGWTMWAGRRNIKRLDIALKAFAVVHEHNPNTCLVIAGSIPDWAETMVEDLKISDAVLFAGCIDREGIKNLAHWSHCCIVPSDHDPLGLPVMESLAAGHPVVATRCGGPDSVLTERMLGRLTDKGDIAGFADAMAEVCGNYDQFQREKIQAHCKKFYSEAAIAQKLLTIYKEVQ